LEEPLRDFVFFAQNALPKSVLGNPDLSGRLTNRNPHFYWRNRLKDRLFSKRQSEALPAAFLMLANRLIVTIDVTQNPV
jgi:hypothetical protein